MKAQSQDEGSKPFSPCTLLAGTVPPAPSSCCETPG